VGQRGVDESYGPHQIDVERGLPVLRSVRDRQRTDIGDGDVDATERRGGILHPGGDRGFVAYVDGRSDYGALVGQLLGGAGDRIGRTSAERDLGALGEQPADDGAADAAGASGDQRATA